MAAPNYEIYALKYAGPFTRPASMMVWFQDMDKTVQTDYFIFVIRGGGETVVVDCGVRPDLAAERQLAGYVNPAEVLKRIGVDAGKVKHLVVTHVHFDHVSGIRLFPKADIYIQEKEFRFWFKDPIAKRAPFLHVSDLGENQYLKKLEGSKRLHRIAGDKKILPGIELVLAPGHTPGMQAVVVNTARGKAVVGSDVAHFFVSYRNDIPSAIITDMRAWMKTYDKLRAKASAIELMFPGHDPAMLKDFPRVAEDVVRLV